MHPDVEIRRATQTDLEAFYGRPMPFSVMAWIALWKGEAACIAGVAFTEGVPIAFSDVKPNLDAPIITIWRAAKTMLEDMRSKGHQLIVALEIGKDNSEKFLKSLGFCFLNRDETKAFYFLPRKMP